MGFTCLPFGLPPAANLQVVAVGAALAALAALTALTALLALAALLALLAVLTVLARVLAVLARVAASAHLAGLAGRTAGLARRTAALARRTAAAARRTARLAAAGRDNHGVNLIVYQQVVVAAATSNAAGLAGRTAGLAGRTTGGAASRASHLFLITAAIFILTHVATARCNRIIFSEVRIATRRIARNGHGSRVIATLHCRGCGSDGAGR